MTLKQRRSILMRVSFVTAAVCALSPSAALAQSTAGINAGIQFDFALPGARSVGMAGAFVAIADDATASQANPAGLTTLTRPEVSIEGRGWNFFSSYIPRGHAYGSPTNIGVDTIAGLPQGEIRDTTGALSFLSFVAPVGQWAIAGHRHHFSNFKNHTRTEGPFIEYPDGAIRRTNPGLGEIELDIVNYGASVARRFGEKFSIGGTLTYSRFDINSYGVAYIVLPHDTVLPRSQYAQFAGIGQQFGPADFSAPKNFFEEFQNGESSGWSGTFGVLARPVPKWTLGAAYRLGPVFEYDASFTAGPAHQTLTPSPFRPGQVVDSDSDINFNVPDAVALGVAFAPRDTVKLSFEYDFVRYSELLDGTGDGLPVDTAGRLQDANAATREEGRLIQEGLTLDDIHVVRAGGEWIFLRQPTVLVARLGTWYDPDHTVYFVDRENRKDQIPNLRELEATYPKGPDEWHFAAGFGAAFSRFQIDAAIDLSPRVNTFSVSSVIYFR